MNPTSAHGRRASPTSLALTKDKYLSGSAVKERGRHHCILLKEMEKWLPDIASRF